MGQIVRTKRSVGILWQEFDPDKQERGPESGKKRVEDEVEEKDLHPVLGSPPHELPGSFIPQKSTEVREIFGNGFFVTRTIAATSHGVIKTETSLV